MWRIQIPLAPEKERTVQTAQGMTMDAAKIFLTRPGTMSHEDWWFHVYVMLSRVRTVEKMLLFGLPPKAVFEAGPPEWIVRGMAKLEKIARSAGCRERLAQAVALVGWEASLSGDGDGRGEATAGDDEARGGPEAAAGGGEGHGFGRLQALWESR